MPTKSDDFLRNLFFPNGCEFTFSLSSDSNKFKVTRVVYNDPATIVFWADGTKTVVKCMDDAPFDEYTGFCAAVVKKVFGSTTKAKKIAGLKKRPDQAVPGGVVEEIVEEAIATEETEIAE